MRPLPTARFEYYRICERSVHFDGHIEVDGAYYSAPPRYAGRKVTVHVGQLWLRIVDVASRECVREHVIASHRGQRRTADVDRPKQTPVQVEQLVVRIGGAGLGCKAFAEQIVHERGTLALRALYGMLGLLRKYDAAEVDRACTFATSASTTSFRFLRQYLEHHATAIKLRDKHGIIAGIATYTDHFKTHAKGANP